MTEISTANIGNILYGKDLANSILEEVALEVSQLKQNNEEIFLMTLEVGSDPASRVYLESQRRAAQKVGINYECIELSQNTSQERLLGVIKTINRDPSINGLIVHMPLPKHIDQGLIQWSINSEKDIEGVSPHNMGKLFLGGDGLKPCTPQAIVDLIKSTDVKIKGKEAVVVGHSNIVGKPASILLLNEEATLTVCHFATWENDMVEEHVRKADILVVAVGQPELIKGPWIKKGAIVIDAGINRVENGIVGDVEFESALKNAAFITPVPRGVGEVTVAHLMKNTVQAFKQQMKNKTV